MNRELNHLTLSEIMRAGIEYFDSNRQRGRAKMIRCYLSKFMGERKLNIAEMARQTGIPRSTITSLYDETAVRIDLEVIETLCLYFNCGLNDLLILQHGLKHKEYINEKKLVRNGSGCAESDKWYFKMDGEKV
ncbi:helix-turn-helix domain-containing protein [Lelliottia wanjuensis]|uniref:helix-turn-helix domain-containing protein n=1 Tax=Lelliottia wanjuensis TaxID=3050585 RepID=UPI003307666B